MHKLACPSRRLPWIPYVFLAGNPSSQLTFKSYVPILPPPLCGSPRTRSTDCLSCALPPEQWVPKPHGPSLCHSQCTQGHSSKYAASLSRAGNRASRPGHRALARSSLLRDWFPCAGAVLSLAQTHRGRPQTTSWQPFRKSGNLCLVWTTVYAKVLRPAWLADP